MTFEKALKIAEEKNIPYKYSKEMVESGFFTKKAEKQFKQDFILTVRILTK